VETNAWPKLPLASWKDTLATLHRYAQVVGKVKLALTPRLNHFWNAGLTVTPRGLTTGAMPSGDELVAIDFDLLDHNVVVTTSRMETRELALIPRPVASFYQELMGILASLGIEPRISDRPVEMQEELIRFSEDRMHGSYDRLAVERCLRILQSTSAVLEQFRARFIGKASPVLFYWGTFDLSAARYSGRRAQLQAGADSIVREAFSHECFECGFWPGDSRFPDPAYFAFAAPAPAGISSASVSPAEARWNDVLGEFLLPYEAVRTAAHPAATLLSFFESTWEAAAALGGWDRDALEAPSRLEGHPPALH
jgi:hypothetical protein